MRNKIVQRVQDISRRVRIDITDRLAAHLRVCVDHPRAICVTVALFAGVSCLFIPDVTLQLSGRALIPSKALNQRQVGTGFSSRDIAAVYVHSRISITSDRGLRKLHSISSELKEIQGIASHGVLSLHNLPLMTFNGVQLDSTKVVDSAGRIDAARSQQLRTLIADLELQDGVLLSADAHSAAIYAEVLAEANRRSLLDDIRSLVKRHSDDDFEVELAGNALAQSILGEVVGEDLLVLIPMVVMILGLLLTTMFRSLTIAVLILAEVGATILIITGLIGLLGQPVFITTLVLPVLVMVIGVSDDVYALADYQHATTAPNVDIRQAVVDSFTRVAAPVLLTSMTTCIGLASMSWFDLAPQKTFGIYGALSIAISTVFTFSLLPASIVLLGLVPAVGDNDSQTVRRTFARVSGWILESRSINGIFLALVLVGIVASAHIRVEDSWISNLPSGSDVVQGSRAFDRHMAGATPLELVVDSGVAGGCFQPEWISMLAELEAELRMLDEVGAVRGAYTDLLRLQAAMDGTTIAQLQRRIGAEGIEEVLRIESSVMMILAASPSFLTSRFDDSARLTRLTVFIKAADSTKIGRVWAVADAFRASHADQIRELYAFGDAWISYETVRALVRGQAVSLPIAMLLEVLVLTFAFGSIGLAVLAMSPVIVSLLVVLGIMALCDIPLGIANSMFVPITLGIGVDYSVHFLSRCRRRASDGQDGFSQVYEALHDSGWPILGGATAVAIGHAVLLFSNVQPNRHLGGLVALCVLLSAVTTLFLLPRLYLKIFHRPRQS